MASITVYTKPACIQCTMTKRSLDKLGLPYDIIDISEDTDAYDKVIALGFSSAPVVIAGDEAWAGFQPERISALVPADAAE